MRFLVTIVLLILSVSTPVKAQEKRISLTFERLPAMKPLGFFTPRELARLVIRSLREHDIQAMGFVINDKILDDQSSYVVLDDWLKAGHILGNNTATYMDFNEVPVKDFLQDIADGQRYIRQALRGLDSDANYRFLRFPLLHAGDTLKKRRELLKRLDNASYRVVPVSVVTADYQFNWAYSRHGGDMATLNRLKQLYLAHIADALDYAESQSQAVLGRSVAHILQLHLGLATANFLPDALQLIHDRGYRFITVAEALADPAYAEPDTYVGPARLSHIDRMAAEKGLPFRESLEPSRREIEAAVSSPAGH